MTKRITIVLSDSMNKKLRIIQAKQQANADYSISFSRVIEEQLKKVVK